MERTKCDDAVKQLGETLGQPLDDEQVARLEAMGGLRALFEALELAWSDLDAGNNRAFEILADTRGIHREPAWTRP